MDHSLEQITELMRQHGAMRAYAKLLAPNDNSKNQIYLGGDFSALNILPHGDVITDTSDMAGSKRPRPKAPLKLLWIDGNGRHLAPFAQLVLYPDYPEVRMSGFLKGCPESPSNILASRDVGRVLVLGIVADGTILAYAANAGSQIAKQIANGQFHRLGVFLELPVGEGHARSSKDALLAELCRIHRRGWIQSQKLARDGQKMPYSARNGGGYTLEAELGICPNGVAEPDYMGWEVKQFGVRDFAGYAPLSPVTLMTPEPNGGIYRDLGPTEFTKRYGYADKSGKPDRINFGGIYACEGKPHSATGLKMTMNGINDLSGGIILSDQNDNIAASWSFHGLMAHWNRKHAQAAYIPSLFDTPPPLYSYGKNVLMCEGTDFMLFIKAFLAGAVYYDPAIKVENASTQVPQVKRRSQFRIKHTDLGKMYHRTAVVDVTRPA